MEQQQLLPSPDWSLLSATCLQIHRPRKADFWSLTRTANFPAGSGLGLFVNHRKVASAALDAVRL